ncbi:MAG TPA: M20/M25/M40 family metallo-hydrolase [Chitinophagaceae bacterium]|jgi:Zn-dependent M28 family amino/carboxypeptidase
MAYLQQKGALAILTKYNVARDGTIFVNGSEGFEKDSRPPLTQVVITTEDYLKIQRLLDAHQPVEMEIDIRNHWYTDNLEGYNVIGEIPGSDPALKDQVVMIGAHLDSWHSGTGATDNGAGCIVMMEAIRLLKILGVQPKRTIRIALWSGEEQGLKGSFGYVKKHFGDPADMRLKLEQKNISVYFNLDNGTGKIRGIYLQHNEAAKPIFENWFAPFTDLEATGITNSSTGSTDHLSFDAVGIPAFEFIQDPLDYETRTHHSNMDVYDHLEIDDLKQASLIVAGLVYDAAMCKDMLPRKPLPKAQKFVYDTH